MAERQTNLVQVGKVSDVAIDITHEYRGPRPVRRRWPEESSRASRHLNAENRHAANSDDVISASPGSATRTRPRQGFERQS